MDPKPISELAKLSFEICNLKLTLLQTQAQQIVLNRDKIAENEFKRLKLNPSEWQLDEQNGMIVKKPELKKDEETKKP